MHVSWRDGKQAGGTGSAQVLSNVKPQDSQFQRLVERLARRQCAGADPGWELEGSSKKQK